MAWSGGLRSDAQGLVCNICHETFLTAMMINIPAVLGDHPQSCCIPAQHDLAEEPSAGCCVMEYYSVPVCSEEHAQALLIKLKEQFRGWEPVREATS